MIDFLSGRLDAVSENCLTLALFEGQVGMELWVSRQTLAVLPPAGSEVRLFVHEVLKEDSFQLFGFLEQAERRMFRLFLKVSGLGPKLALAILSYKTPAQAAHAILAMDPKAFMEVPGIGRKMAERILLELKGLVGQLELAMSGGLPDGTLHEVVVALKGLGFSHAEAQKACREALGDQPSIPLEEGILRALRHLRH